MPAKKSAPQRPSPVNPGAAKKGQPGAAKRGGSKKAGGVQAGRGAAVQLFDPGRISSLLDQVFTRFWQVRFARPDDLFVCDFVFDNLKRQGQKLVRRDPSKSATLIVELPPQSFGEEAFLDATGPETNESFDETSSDIDPEDENPPVVEPKNVARPAESLGGDVPVSRIRMAGRSRIAFAMPAAETSVGFTAEALLDACRRWPMRLDVNATPDPKFDAIRDVGVFDQQWLQQTTSSSHWQAATDAWMEALPKPETLGEPLKLAAQRIALQASAAQEANGPRVTGAALTRAMQGEIDTLAKSHPELQDAEKRNVALGVMSLMAGRAVAERPGKLDFSKLPFFGILLGPHKPVRSVTALEVPYRLILSPLPHAHWRHAAAPVTRNSRTELWHTRLTSNTAVTGPDLPTKLRALWSPDYPLEREPIVEIVNKQRPFRMPLDALDRQMLVRLMAGFLDEDADGDTYVPHAARAQRLALSSLGALLDIEGSWTQLPAGVGLEQWRHLATLGRDQYVRVVYRGFLCPYGHAASLIKVTERKFENLPRGTHGRVAVLRQRFFIVVREPVKEFTGAGHKFEGRTFPFTSVEILTRVTPSLVAPEGSKLKDPGNKIYSVIPNRACFWPMLTEANDFLFQIAATDLCGERVTFAMPLLFVGVEANVEPPATGGIQKPAPVVNILQRYNAQVEAPRRTTSLGNAIVCFAPPKADAEGDPRLPTAQTTFAAGGVTGISPTRPQFYPELTVAQVGIAAIQRLLNKPDAVVEVEYANVYAQSGFVGNAGEIYLKTRQAFSLAFGEGQKSDSLGALVSPNMEIQGLSRIMGPVAAKPPADPTKIEDALANVISNNFNPADFFKGAKILGGVDLADILGTLPKPLAGANVPKLVTKQSADRNEARFTWDTAITNSDPLGLFVPDPSGKTRLTMNSVISSSIPNPAATTFRAEATLKSFEVNLFGFVTIAFKQLRFVSETGLKPDVAVDLEPGLDENELPKAIAFGGPLEFVNELRKIIPANGFSDPPNLSVTPSGIAASYSLALPSVTVGIFALENVSIGCGFSLPFDARPVEVRFNFSERQRPFSLTVSMLGGGGFFAIGIGTEGVREIEAALEFGARLSIDLGVASGSVEVKAGVYFHWLEKSVELGGYVRIYGELSIIGLISVSLTFNLQLSYLKEGTSSLVWGEATLVVEVEVLCFSADVSVKCRREFAGSQSDPKFKELILTEEVWSRYCGAFAEE